LPPSSESLGQFGDFVGGLLNPIVAYSAFYWLTQSVRLQKEELSETRAALVEAATAQTAQVQYAQTSVRIAALTAIINSIMAEVQVQRSQLEFIITQPTYSASGNARLLSGEYLHGTAVQSHIDTINAGIANRMTERIELESALNTILKGHS
jgi:hypothetical protein